jgi:DNA invertase Pin-like site-specific DNA recombinase
MSTNLSESNRQRILDLFDAGYLAWDIHRETGHSRSTIRRALRKAGKTRPKREIYAICADRVWKDRRDAVKPEIRRMVKAGMTMEAIAKKLGACNKVVSRAIRADPDLEKHFGKPHATISAKDRSRILRHCAALPEKPIAMVARHFNVNLTTVHRILEGSGMASDLKSIRDAAARRRRADLVIIEAAVAAGHRSIAAVSRHTGIPKTRVKQTLEEAGKEDLTKSSGPVLPDTPVMREWAIAIEKDRAAVVLRSGRPEFGMSLEKARKIIARHGLPDAPVRSCGTAAALCEELADDTKSFGRNIERRRDYAAEKARRRKALDAVTFGEAA